MKVTAEGYWWDQDAADRVVEFFERYLRHVRGPWAGRPLKLEPWQRKDLIEPLFAWKRPHSITHRRGEQCDAVLCDYGRRRYRVANGILPRKNTKTTLGVGILLIGLCADDELGGENYCMAGDLAQAEDLAFDTAVAMVEKSPTLRKRLQIWRSENRIVDPVTDSFLQAIPGDWEGALGFSPHVALMDEHLVQANTKLENAITSGMGARRQPLFIRMSTAPESISTPTGRIIQRIRDIRAGLREAPPDELNILYEAPEKADWRKVKTWIAVNPGYGTSLQPSFVVTQIRRAIDEPEERAEILQYGLNMIPDEVGSCMPLERWDECGREIMRVKELEGRACVIAVSMPSATDLAAVAVVFLPTEEDDRYRLFSEIYLPGDLLRSRAQQENAPPLHEWVEKGLLHLTDGEELDYSVIETVVLRTYGADFEVREIVCNPRGSRQFMQRLMDEDATVVELMPSYKTHSPAWNDLRELMGAGRFAHDGNAAVRWMWSKARMRKGPDEAVRLDRERSRGNIEGPVAILSAVNRATVQPAEQEAAWSAS